MSSGRKVVLWLLMPLWAAVALVPAECPGCDLGMACTWRAWKRTWHGPNALATPLRPYSTPRTSAWCEYEGCAAHCGSHVEIFSPPVRGDHCGCSGQRADGSPHSLYGLSVDDCRFERLGQVPNDMELSAGLPAATSARSAP